MNEIVRKSFDAGIKAYAKSEGVEAADFTGALEQAFNLDAPFLDKVKALDGVFDDHQRFEELREVYFDLLMINFFTEDVEKLQEDYLESDEWEAIEEETIDRGTELLNIFLYLDECLEGEIEPSLDDYLKEFLLVDEDEFQDEYNIYEQVIANQILVDSNYAEISKVANGLSYDDDLKDLFYPIMSFFNELAPTEAQLEEYKAASSNPSLDVALYQIISNFK